MSKSKHGQHQHEYDASAIHKLDAITAIRQRTGMYLGNSSTEGLHHASWEVIDNSVDEYLAGYCKRIRVHLDTKENSIAVDDDGRGIPVEVHSQTKRSTLESIFTEIHMGGKFEKEKSGYSTSGGLHGIGVTATCAVSSLMKVQTVRGGKVYSAEFSQGKVTAPLAEVPTKKGKASGSGTRVWFHPDPEIFGKTKFDADMIRDRLEAIAFLCPGLTVLYRVNDAVTDMTSKDGLAGFLRTRLSKEEKPAFDSPIMFTAPIPGNKDQGIDVAMWWTDGDAEKWYTYVNMIPVPDGGTHVTGAKTAITRELKKLCDKDGVTGDDFRDGLRVVCHLRLTSPQFEGQTKNRLNNPECTLIADQAFSEHLRLFFSKHGSVAKMLIARAVEMAKARAAYKASRKIATQTAYAKDGSDRRGLPEELTAALRCKVSERETFIVEGGSAGGSALQGRDGYTQEVLPLRGKIPNAKDTTDPVKLAAFFGNGAIDAIIRTIGAGHDVDKAHESCNPTKARQAKVIIMADADTDGGHITCLLLIFFLRFMLPLVEDGRIWVARPPLFVAKWVNGRVFGDTRDEVISKAAEKGIKKVHITRLKGLAEMQPGELAETCMRLDSRRLIKISADLQSVEVVMNLMGSDVSMRKELIFNN